MYLEKSAHPKHTGTERYGVEFEIKESGNQFDVKGAYVKYKIRPETVLLAWERLRRDNGYGPWRRRTVGGGGGSRIVGPRVLKDDSTSDRFSTYVDVFATSDVGGPLTTYAASLPHLEQMIAELEKNLPT